MNTPKNDASTPTINTPENELILTVTLKRKHNDNSETIVEIKIPRTATAAEEKKEPPRPLSPIWAPKKSVYKHRIDNKKPSITKPGSRRSSPSETNTTNATVEKVANNLE